MNARFKNVAKTRGTHPDNIRHQYVFALLFKRLFSPATDTWMLLGGNALLIRTGGGRFTQDIDLARSTPWNSPEEVATELRALASRDVDTDPFRFEIRGVAAHNEIDPYGYGATTLKATVTVLLGAAEFHTFTIDITTRRHVDGPVDVVQPTPVIDHETLRGIPSVPTVPVENHLADKICALYELHGRTRTPSTRYRDLADIVRIIKELDFDASRLTEMLRHETGRRRLILPHAIKPPSPAWEREFPKQARTFADYPEKLYPLHASLHVATKCLNVILDGSRLQGNWNHVSATWID